MSQSWDMPELLKKPDGEPRQVGIEIEFQGIEIGALAELVASTLGASLERVSSAEFNAVVDDVGSYRIEVDFALLKELALQREQRTDSDSLRDLAVELLDSASAGLVPCEVVTPPLPMRTVAEPMDALTEALRDAGAIGTHGSMLYAFGVHLNVEPPTLDADTVLRYLRAFVCLYDWIVAEDAVDLTRQLSPYIRPFGRDYDLLVADPDYAPTFETMIDDYLAHNPTRDRALDMLPLFSHIDESRVQRIVDDPLVNARPAFHYRLSNCCIDEPHWSIAKPWNLWVVLERLANDTERLNDVATAFIADRDRMMRAFDNRWVDALRERLKDMD